MSKHEYFKQLSEIDESRYPNDTPTLVWVLRGDEGYGVESTVCAFSKALIESGWNVFAFCLMPGRLGPRLHEVGIKVETLDVKSMPHRVSGSFVSRLVLLLQSFRAEKDSIKLINSLLTGLEVDVVETTNMLLLNTIGRVAKNCGALPVWRMANHVKPRTPINLPRLYLQFRCSMLGILAMGNSQYTTDTLGAGFAKKISNLHGCNPDRFDPETVTAITRDEFNIKDHELVLGIVARMSPDGDKGQLRLVETMAKLGAKSSNVHILLIGGPVDSPFADEIKKISNECKQFQVTFTGELSNVEQYYGLIDVAVNARLSPEPFGLSVVEAMMMGVPVLAHASGGPSETIIDNKTGWLVQDMNVDTLAARLLDVLGAESEWKQMGDQARQHALANFRIQDEVERWLEATGFES